MDDMLTLQTPALIKPKTWACVVRLGGVGDNLIASSLLPLLARRHQVEVIAQDPWHVIFENNPHIAKLTVKKCGDFPSGGGMEWQQWFVSRSKEYAHFIHLSHSIETTLAVVPAQTQFNWPDDMRRAWCGRSYLEFAHDIAGLPHEFNPRFYPTDEEMATAWKTKAVMGNQVIAWVLSGTRIDKIYPAAPIVIARLIREMGPVVLVGSTKEWEIAEQIVDHVQRENGSLNDLHVAVSPPDKNTWPIRRSLAQLHTCDLVIGPDTGPMWAVATEKMSKIMLLSHASKTNITKHWINTHTLHASKEVTCWPCHKLHDTKDTCTPNSSNSGAACITDIQPTHIINTARRCMASLGLGFHPAQVLEKLTVDEGA